MRTRFMATAAGDDQQGLIKKMAEKTHLHGGVWMNSKIIHLGGLFAGLIHIDVPEENAAKLKQEFGQIGGLNISFSDFAEPSGNAQLLEMKFETNDRPGIINDIASLLSDEAVVIENMTCHRFNVPNLGETVFCGEFLLRVPPDLDRASLIEELETLYDSETRVTIE